MHRTRTIVRVLAGVAVAALSGCVSVQPHPGTAPSPAASRPAAGDLSPQIGRPPVRDTLEALPDPKASPSATTGRTAAGRAPAAPPATPHTGPRAPAPRDNLGPARPLPHRAPPFTPAAPVPPLPAPAGGKDVCALGRGYGHWPAGSPQSRICDHTYGH
ncbi:hypothetical protein ACFVW8_34510 [Streptomyces sp. NPDC058221]|uniref:hypothetical protein n=1 Tax=Streptomyces sp. NPDC058221 TaxID=3346388 RepID=UPI0036ED181E